MDTRSRRAEAPVPGFYAALSRTNSAILRIRDPQALFEEICAICTEHGNAKVAYIAIEDERGYARPIAWAGPADEFLSGIEIPLNPSLGAGQGPIALAVQRGEPYIANDLHADPSTSPWRRRAMSLGSNATAAFPIQRGGRVIGALSLHVPRKNFFDASIIQLLQAMVGDLSYALDNIDREAERAAAVRETTAGLDRFRKIFETAPVATAIWAEEDGRPLEANDAFCALLGFAREDFASAEFRAEAQRCYTDLRLAGCSDRLRERRRIREHEATLQSRSGHARDVSLSAELIEFDGRGCLLTIISDITERKAYESSLEHFATHDALTGLPNRHLFYDRAAQALSQSRRSNTMSAIALVDLDRMKVVNDELGHRIGDVVLQLVGERLRGTTIDGDSVARLGGDKFAMLLTGFRVPPDARMRVTKVSESFASPFWVLGNELRLTASIGFALYPRDGADVDALIRNADTAMYAAKQLGSGACQVYMPEMAVESRPKRDLEIHLRRAIDLEQLHVEYQPKVRLSDGTIVGAEALLRWRHPELGMVPPATFIPIAEETGLIDRIGEWVLREACAQGVAWQRSGLSPIPIAVNVSAHQLLQPKFEAQVISALQATGLSPEWLELEITESAIARDVQRVSVTIGELNSIGVRFSIDDFGTGYSSLSYLKQFQVNRVKIDQSFVRNVPSDATDAAIVRAIVALARSVGLEVTAEGVETIEQCRFLREAGCEEIQGYLFSRPVSALAFSQMLSAGKTLEMTM